MRKGSNVIYEGKLYKVYEKCGNAVKIYQPDAKYPELTMLTTSIKKVKKA